MPRLEIELKEIKGLREWARKQFPDNKYIYYKRSAKYAQCKCSECGGAYEIRTESTGDPFEDTAVDIEKPERDKATKCRACGAKAIYKPAGHTARTYNFEHIITGQKLSDDKFVFEFWYAWQETQAGQETYYGLEEDRLIICERGKKAKFYKWNTMLGWIPGAGIAFTYYAHPSVFREIKKTGMYKYIPVPEAVIKRYYGDSWIADIYVAAARYPDFEMLVKLGMNHYYERLIYGYTTNINPRGKTIENRLRIRKDRLKKIVEAKGDYRLLCLYQLEKRYGAKWTDEELEIVEKLCDHQFSDSWQIPLRYASPTRIKNYMIKQKMWINDSFQARTKMQREGIQSTYFDYLHMKVSQGYEMNDVNLFPKDIRRRHDEMVLETEKAKIEKRNKEVLGKFPKIKSKYKKLSEKYSAAAGGLIIRPAKDAAEIVVEGRILHHCVGGDNYLHKHNTGKSTILFLRKAKEKDIPYITVEIKDEEVLQWYGAYDRKPDKKMIDAWLKTYTKELTKRKKVKSCTSATKRRTA